MHQNRHHNWGSCRMQDLRSIIRHLSLQPKLPSPHPVSALSVVWIASSISDFMLEEISGKWWALVPCRGRHSKNGPREHLVLNMVQNRRSQTELTRIRASCNCGLSQPSIEGSAACSSSCCPSQKPESWRWQRQTSSEAEHQNGS